MNYQQIAAIYDSMTPKEQDMPRSQFIKQVFDALDPDKMVAEADRMVRGRVQQKQIDAAIRRGQG